jgi:polyferredoxin
MTGILRAIERWASVNDDRMRLIIILVWASFGMLVLISTVIAAWIMLPPEYQLF